MGARSGQRNWLSYSNLQGGCNYVTPQTRKSSEGSTVPDVERRGGNSPWHLAGLGADDTSGYRRPDFQYRSSIGLDLYYCILPYFLLRISFDSLLFDMVYILIILASYDYSVPEAPRPLRPNVASKTFRQVSQVALDKVCPGIKVRTNYT
jgi:hypothetical protein